MTSISNLNTYYDTQDADVLAEDILDGKVAYGIGGKIIGEMPETPTDPHFANVVALMPDEGISGMQMGHTSYGGIFTSTSPKFGSLSYESDGSLDQLRGEIPALGTADFTIETWLWPINGGAGNNYGRIVQLGNNSTNGGLYIARLNAPNPLTILVQCYASGYNTVFSPGTSIANDAWTHVAIVRESGDWAMYYDGTRVAHKTTAQTGDNLTATSFFLGSNHSVSEGFNGRYNQFRITAGVARYSGGTLTVPTERFPRQ